MCPSGDLKMSEMLKILDRVCCFWSHSSRYVNQTQFLHIKSSCVGVCVHLMWFCNSLVVGFFGFRLYVTCILYKLNKYTVANTFGVSNECINTEDDKNKFSHMLYDTMRKLTNDKISKL